MLSTPSTTNTTSLTSATRTMSRQRPQRALLVTWTLLLIALCALASPAVGQVLYGSIVGNVVDETRGNLPGATITILHNESGQSRETVSDSMGAYRFTAVQPGTYTVTVKLEGFRTFTRQDVAVTLNSVARVDVPLQVGQLSEAVTVTAERPLLQTDRAEVRSELQSNQLVNLPVSMNRNYQYLFRVLPGFTPPAEAHSVPSNPSRALVFNVNGASRSSNNIRIDGVSTTNIWLPHVAAYVPALESLDTVNIVTSSFDAEQGLAGGSAINAQIKSGTNNFRGSLFEYLHRRAAADAELLRATRYAEGRLAVPTSTAARSVAPSSTTRFRRRGTHAARCLCIARLPEARRDAEAPRRPCRPRVHRVERARRNAHVVVWRVVGAAGGDQAGTGHQPDRRRDRRIRRGARLRASASLPGAGPARWGSATATSRALRARAAADPACLSARAPVVGERSRVRRFRRTPAARVARRPARRQRTALAAEAHQRLRVGRRRRLVHEVHVRSRATTWRRASPPSAAGRRPNSSRGAAARSPTARSRPAAAARCPRARRGTARRRRP